MNYNRQFDFFEKALDKKLRVGEKLIFEDWEWTYVGISGEKHVFDFYNNKLKVQLGFFIYFDNEHLIALNRHRFSEIKNRGNFEKCLNFLIDFFKFYIVRFKQEKICIIFQIDFPDKEGGIEIISWLEKRNYKKIAENRWIRIY